MIKNLYHQLQSQFYSRLVCELEPPELVYRIILNPLVEQSYNMGIDLEIAITQDLHMDEEFLENLKNRKENL